MMSSLLLPEGKVYMMSMAGVNWKRVQGWSRDSVERGGYIGTQGADYAKNCGFYQEGIW